MQEMCRTKIRNILRQNTEREFPNLRKAGSISKKLSKRKFPLRRLVVPIFDNSEDSSDGGEQEEREEAFSMRNGRAQFGFSPPLDRGRLLTVNIIREIIENSERMENVDNPAEEEEVREPTENQDRPEVEVEDAVGEMSGDSFRTCEVEALVEPQPQKNKQVKKSHSVVFNKGCM